MKVSKGDTDIALAGLFASVLSKKSAVMTLQ